MNEKLIDKLMKINELAERGEPGERNAAKAAYQAIMEKYDLTEDDIEKGMYQIQSLNVKFTGINSPEYILAHIVAKIFNCLAIAYATRQTYNRCHFYGKKEDAALAEYSFDVLYRLLKKRKQEFYKNCHIRDTYDRRIEAKSFAIGWVYGIEDKVRSIIPAHYNETKDKLRELYSKHVKQLKTSKIKCVNISQKSFAKGEEIGASENFNLPVDTQDTFKKLSA